MSVDVAQPRLEERARVSPRVRAVLALGPATCLAGFGWALLQPWRLTLLHPHGQGFWWLLSEPPLYVVLAGLLFRLVVAPGIAADLEEHEQ
ncbi:MAG: hypothetical protein V7644_379 [Actinomycetota bacterium]